MTTQFHEGQEVEVWCFPDGEWEKAKIVRSQMLNSGTVKDGRCDIIFPDGTSAVFDETHIRPVSP